MKRILLFLSVLALLVVAVASGNIPFAAAALAAFLISASLAPVNSHLAACASPFDALRIATDNLPSEIYRKASWFSPLIAYIKRGVFPKNAGTNQKNFVIGNSEPVSNAESWTEVTTTSNVVATVCSSTYTDVDVGYTETSYNPRRFGLAGPVLCRETFAFAHKPKQFIDQYIRELTKRAKRTWEFQYRNTFMALSNKYISRPGQEIQSGSVALASAGMQVAATSELTIDQLSKIAMQLIQDGATDADQDMIELGPSGPIFPLLISPEAIDRLYTNTVTRRADANAAYMGKGAMSPLWQRIGATDVIRNFRLVPEVLPPRFDFTPGLGYTQVNTFEMVSTTHGTQSRLTDAYKNALYEGALQLHPDVFHAEIVQPDNAGLPWSGPRNYMGEWVFVEGGKEINISDCFDPLKKYARHFAEFMYAPNPIFPNFGTTIIYKRCPSGSWTTGCTYP